MKSETKKMLKVFSYEKHKRYFSVMNESVSALANVYDTRHLRNLISGCK